METPFGWPCPYPTCNLLHDPFAPIPHIYDASGQFDAYPERYSARWRHGLGPCCEWCQLWEEIGQQVFTLMDVGRDVVFPLFQMMKLWDSIHLRYQRRRIGGPGSYRLAQRVDIMSQMVWECQYSFPELRSDFKQLSTELRDRATELQVGPARKLYYPMPRLLGY